MAEWNSGAQRTQRRSHHFDLNQFVCISMQCTNYNGSSEWHIWVSETVGNACKCGVLSLCCNVMQHAHFVWSFLSILFIQLLPYRWSIYIYVARSDDDLFQFEMWSLFWWTRVCLVAIDSSTLYTRRCTGYCWAHISCVRCCLQLRISESVI